MFNLLQSRAGLATLGLVASALPAFAHAHLKIAKPAVDSTVAGAPRELDLTFTEGVTLKFTGVKLIGPDAKTVETSAARLGSDDKTLVVPLPSSLPAGAYTVEWHALATDGHKTNGHYTFTVKP